MRVYPPLPDKMLPQKRAGFPVIKIDRTEGAHHADWSAEWQAFEAVIVTLSLQGVTKKSDTLYRSPGRVEWLRIQEIQYLSPRGSPACCAPKFAGGRLTQKL